VRYAQCMRVQVQGAEVADSVCSAGVCGSRVQCKQVQVHVMQRWWIMCAVHGVCAGAACKAVHMGDVSKC
jgi:hypothetical protein